MLSRFVLINKITRTTCSRYIFFVICCYLLGIIILAPAEVMINYLLQKQPYWQRHITHVKGSAWHGELLLDLDSRSKQENLSAQTYVDWWLQPMAVIYGQLQVYFSISHLLQQNCVLKGRYSIGLTTNILKLQRTNLLPECWFQNPVIKTAYLAQGIQFKEVKVEYTRSSNEITYASGELYWPGGELQVNNVVFNMPALSGEIQWHLEQPEFIVREQNKPQKLLELVLLQQRQVEIVIYQDLVNLLLKAVTDGRAEVKSVLAGITADKEGIVLRLQQPLSDWMMLK